MSVYLSFDKKQKCPFFQSNLVRYDIMFRIFFNLIRRGSQLSVFKSSKLCHAGIHCLFKCFCWRIPEFWGQLEFLLGLLLGLQCYFCCPVEATGVLVMWLLLAPGLWCNRLRICSTLSGIFQVHRKFTFQRINVRIIQIFVSFLLSV
jgi:hypothetical protein